MLMKYAALAGKSWTAPTSERIYDVDRYGLTNVREDNPDLGTADTTEAKAAGFTPYDQGRQVAVVNKDFGKRKVRKPEGGDIRMSTSGPDVWTAEATGNQYHADDAGMISCFEVDLAEAEKAGFKRQAKP